MSTCLLLTDPRIRKLPVNISVVLFFSPIDESISFIDVIVFMLLEHPNVLPCLLAQIDSSEIKIGHRVHARKGVPLNIIIKIY